IGSCKHSDITIFSFHPIKHITTGEGGALLTNDKNLYENVLKLRTHGIVKDASIPWKYDISEFGFNYRITDFQCALGISQLKRLDKMVAKRRQMVESYNEAFENIAEIRLPYERSGTKASYHLYVIRTGYRDKLYDHLRKQGIYCQINYMPVHLFSLYRKFGYKKGDFPVAEKYADECLSLPLYSSLTQSDQARVIQQVKQFFKHEK
ncbi:MAG: DegT/DnrJ/EryC1/StrS family aminotransferase, partial [Candidatus Omnitrophota bacterium]